MNSNSFLNGVLSYCPIAAEGLEMPLARLSSPQIYFTKMKSKFKKLSHEKDIEENLSFFVSFLNLTLFVARYWFEFITFMGTLCKDNQRFIEKLRFFPRIRNLTFFVYFAQQNVPSAKNPLQKTN